MKQDPRNRELVKLSCPKVKGKDFPDTLLRLNPDTRWFNDTGEKPAEELTSYQRVVETVRKAGRAIKRSEIDGMLGKLLSSAQIGKHLKAAALCGDLSNPRHGYYEAPANTHSLNTIDDEHMSVSEEVVM
jgi:hypothetical protein